MRAVRVVARAFVYGTESEERVLAALLRALGRSGDPDARGRLTRTPVKGHFGTEILLLEAILKRPRELGSFFEQLRTEPELIESLRAEFDRRIDEDRVFHFRFDKQAAVQGRLVLGTGGDALNFAIKYDKRREPGTESFPATATRGAGTATYGAHKL